MNNDIAVHLLTQIVDSGRDRHVAMLLAMTQREPFSQQ